MNFAKAFDLFIRPRKFFSSQEIYGTRFAHLLGAWIVGMNATADQIDKKLIASQATGKANSAVQFALESWGHYWGMLAGLGLIGAFFCWFVGGWWYGKRLQFSGASNVDPMKARKANVYQSLVYDIPALCLTAYYTAYFPNYLATWQSDELWSLLIIVPAVFFSCWVSFVAATTSFAVSNWKAMLWFLVLPIGFCMVALGGFTYLLSMAR